MNATELAKELSELKPIEQKGAVPYYLIMCSEPQFNLIMTALKSTEALKELVRLKQLKEDFGPTTEYRGLKTGAWDQARHFVDELDLIPRRGRWGRGREWVPWKER
jgi:hypothetical protein